MKFNAVKALIVVSLLIIIFYTLGLFLPIINNTKNSKNIFDNQIVKISFLKDDYFSFNLGNNSTKLHGL